MGLGTAEILKHTAHTIAPPLAVIMNIIIEYREFPEQLEKSVIMYIYESGQRDKPINYWSI